MPTTPQEPLHAILPPPDLDRFRELTGVGSDELEVSFEGWSKLAILSRDRVFLFPRWGRDAALLYGARVCEVLTGIGLDCVPRVVGRWPAGVLSAGPFVAFERRPGTPWPRLEGTADREATERMLASLGGLVATWHGIAVPDLPPEIRDEARSVRRQSWLGDLLDPAGADDAVDRAVELLGADDGSASTWRTTVRALSAMAPVLVHGDVCENQLLVDRQGRVDTVLDWDTAGVGHPLLDFDFGEWGFGIFGWEPVFGELRRVMWDAYRAGRPGTDLPGAAEIHLLFTLAELAYFEQQRRTRGLDDWGAVRLARSRDAIGPATEAAARAGAVSGSAG